MTLGSLKNPWTLGVLDLTDMASTDLDTAIATLRAYASGAEPARIVALLDRGEDLDAAMIEWTPEELTVSQEEGEAVMGPVIAIPASLPDLRPIPSTAIEVDREAGQISAPVGAVAHMVEGVRALAEGLGGRSVAAVEWETADPELPLVLAARQGEPVIAAVGEDQFQLGG